MINQLVASATLKRITRKQADGHKAVSRLAQQQGGTMLLGEIMRITIAALTFVGGAIMADASISAIGGGDLVPIADVAIRIGCWVPH